MTFRIIASDLDGTLRADGQPISPRVREAIRRARALGVHVVLATGRLLLTAEPYARELGLVDPVVCNHGATIHDLSTHETVFRRCLPLDITREILAEMDSRSSAVVCTEDGFYTRRLSPEAQRYIGSYYETEHTHIVPDWAESLPREPLKMVFVNNPEVSSELYGDLARRWGDRLHVVQSHPMYVEVTHRGASKGIALAHLAQQWGISRQEVIAVGDWENDASMIEWAGLGVAMGNAIDSIKAIADYVAPTVQEDGVAHVIDKFVLDHAVVGGISSDKPVGGDSPRKLTRGEE